MTETAPRSPCINVCVLNPAGICIGCFRSGEEIARWTSMSAAEQWQVVEAARGRGFEQRAAESGKSLFLEMTVNTTSEVTERIKQQISSGPVVLFMKGTPDFPQCGFSAQTVAALRSVGADFKHVNIFEDPELREGLKRYSNWPTYPQLYINGELIGGCDIALEMMRSGELKKLVQTAGTA